MQDAILINLILKNLPFFSLLSFFFGKLLKQLLEKTLLQMNDAMHEMKLKTFNY